MRRMNRDIFERIDYDSIYVRLLKGAYFQVGNEKPIESVKRSIFENALKLMSIENAQI